MTEPTVTPQAAAALLLKRRQIRRSLAEWARYRGFPPAAHHLLIIREIEAFLAGDEDVLLLFAPPGSAKSTFVSVLFPSHYLSRFPKNSILFATHSVEFAERWGRRVRNDIDSESAVLGITLSEDNKAAARWSLSAGGEYYAVGAGTGISGFRADLGLIDDPFGSREDAWSDTVRKKRWDWYVDDFGNRCKPTAKRIIMATRWHAEDISGRVLEQIERGDVKGHAISIAAEAEEGDVLGRAPGTLLWDEPNGYNYGKFLRQRKAESSPMMWAALFQQKPAPEEGDYWKAAWIKPVDVLPSRETMRTYGASDYAVTADGGDYTVHGVLGIDPDGRMYLLDVWRKQTASDEWVEAFCDLVKFWKPMAWAEEKGQIAAGVGPLIDRRQRERAAYVYRETFPTRGDKAVRAQSMRGRMAHADGGLYVPRNAPWLPTFMSELLSFPAGKHDDQSDMLGLLGQLLDLMLAGQVPRKETNVVNIGYKRIERAVEGFKTY